MLKVLLKTIRRNTRRRSLLWLSIEDVECVKGKLVGLFLEPGQVIQVAATKGQWTDKVEFFVAGVTPVFRYKTAFSPIRHLVGSELTVPNRTFWLKGRNFPYWDYQIGDREIVQLDFNDPQARIPALLIKAYSKHFPFVPTSNYFQKNGEFIA